MFKISPIQSREEQKQCAELCGVPYIDGYFAYSMRDTASGALMGFSQFEIGEELGHISHIALVPGLDDFEAHFILGRATMSFIDQCGVHKATASADTAEHKFLISLGFKDIGGGKYFADMTHFFNGSCHEKKD
jgi:hypothetical protein